MKRIVLLSFLVALAASCRSIPVYNLENPVFKAYWDQVSYPDDDYSITDVNPYSVMSTSFRKDRPAPVPVRWESTERFDSVVVIVSEKKDMSEIFSVECSSGATEQVDLWNLIPGRTYYYSVRALLSGSGAASGNADGNGNVSVTDKAPGAALGWPEVSNGVFRTEGRRRMMCVDGVANVRDLGGLKTVDGRTLKYGMIYRGGEMDGWSEEPITEKGLQVMREVMKIGVDIDYRNEWDLCTLDEDLDNDVTWSRLGEEVEYNSFKSHGIERVHNEPLIGPIYKTFLKALREGKVVYNHCIAGADRTGLMCLLIEASLGVSEEDCAKDYETTSFSKYGNRCRNNPLFNNEDKSLGIHYIKGLEGDSFQEKCCTLLKSHGITDEEIAEFRALMLE